MRAYMAEAIRQLPPDLRQVCLLRDVLQYSTHEVARRLRISAMAVRLRLFRAHRRLWEKLSVSLQPAMRRNSPATMAINAARRGEERKSDQRISLRAFAECPCGD